MRHIHFLSSWTGDGSTTQTAYRCAAHALWRANGITTFPKDMGQPNVLPTPNLCVWEAWVEDAGVALLEADPSNYSILLDEEWGEGLATAKGDAVKEDKPKDEKPDANTKTTLESFLKTKGVKDADAATLSRKSDANATRKHIADNLIAWCNQLPKAKK